MPQELVDGEVADIFFMFSAVNGPSSSRWSAETLTCERALLARAPIIVKMLLIGAKVEFL